MMTAQGGVTHVLGQNAPPLVMPPCPPRQALMPTAEATAQAVTTGGCTLWS